MQALKFFFFFWSLAFDVSAVNFCCYQCEPDSSSLPSPLQICCYLENKFVRILPKIHRLWEDLQIYSGCSVFWLFPESAVVYNDKFQTKLWINELLLCLDESPYIVFILRTDTQSQTTSLPIHSFNNYLSITMSWAPILWWKKRTKKIVSLEHILK